MVDFRPLLFVNALALMLLVTAGFASVRNGMMPEKTDEPSITAAIVDATDTTKEPTSPEESLLDQARQENTPEPAQPQEQELAVATAPQTGAATDTLQESRVSAEAFEVEPLAEDSELLAVAEPVSAITKVTDIHAPRQKTPPTTGTLVLRSNVAGDLVTINGKAYGATRLDLELDPGRYEVIIEKPGYKPWSSAVALKAGQELTLVGRLEEQTTVNYLNGQWIGGIKTGDGTWKDDTGLRYEGHFINGLFHGEGIAWYPDGSRYEGDWENGQQHGEGQWRGADSSEYTGRFERNEFHGKGTLTKANGDIITGNWVQGRIHGAGSLTTADGMLYVGNFRNGEFHGHGTLTYPDGRSYEGEFSNGAFHGKGSEIFADGKRYDGEYMEGKFHGAGLLRNPNGSSIEATFRHGEPYGQVRLTTAAGEIFTARTSEPGVCYRDKSYRATQCPQLEGW
ncbi:PEGA domain-containing protein [Marinobacter sp.]|uniref:MORN repeat-containing protein n=1 Tax=Marinobacter sp. TaxID=50741 RepID=UPI00356356FB